MDTKLNQQEIMAMSYYTSVVRYLVSKGKLDPDFDLGLKLIRPDSTPDSEDYG